MNRRETSRGQDQDEKERLRRQSAHASFEMVMRWRDKGRRPGEAGREGEQRGGKEQVGDRGSRRNQEGG